MAVRRQPKAPFPQPTDAFAESGERDLHSSRDGNARPPAIPATPVTTRPLLHPDDGTEAEPPGPEFPQD